ncbi:hypothetical protein [Variovorax sp. GT1P44]|uniref:hypothetical protein n=1 Tax=Variovorax sp. GT1P44 TaxID=3443742 RepID=UPI003F463BAC
MQHVFFLSFTELTVMSESVVCSACGSTNRAKAKFCTGCARPLPGFEPSGPGALDPVMSHRPALEASSRSSAAVPVLPAETAAFWLKAAYVALAMIVGFTLWCLYVTSKPGAPPLKAEIMGLFAPSGGPAPSSPAPSEASASPPSAVNSEPVAATTPAAVPAAPAASAASEAGASSPLHALLPERGAVSAETSRATTERPAAVPSYPKAESRAPTRSARASTYAARGSRDRAADDEPPVVPVVPVVPSSERRSVEPDPGPPVAAGPGPLYDYSRRPAVTAPPASRDVSASRPAYPDPGPPIAPGPGPRYESGALPAPAVVAPRNDPGPPIAIGPGPLVNYSTRGAGTR